MRPSPVLCDWCRKIAVPGKTGAGALAFQGPDDALVSHTVDGNSTRLIVRAEPAAGRAERLVFVAHIVIAVLLLGGIALKPGIALPILVVSVVVLLSGLWLSRVSGARTEFTIDGSTFTARGWRGGSVTTSPRDVRDMRIDGKGPSVEHNRPRTAYDIAVSLDDGTTHIVKAQFLRHEYAEMTLAHLRDAVARGAQR